MLEIDVFLPGLMAADGAGLFDANGAALVVHEKADDYRSDPAGDAGKRIACGAIQRITTRE